jgi:molybdopterin converting factor small subunit
LREDVARSRLLGFLRENLTGPKEVAFIRKTVAEVLGNLSRKTNAEIAERRQRLARTEERIAGLIQFIADGDRSDYVRVALRDLEAQAKMEKAAIADLEARRSEAVRLPSIEETVERAMLFEKNLLENPTAGREALRHLFEDGKISCRPQPEGVYLAEGKFFPLALFSLRFGTEPVKARDLEGAAGLLGPSRGTEPPCSIVGCAGRI